jgi:hypothetical protein
VDAISVLVALNLLCVVMGKTHHIVCGNPTLLDVLAGRVQPRVGRLGQARLEREQIIRHLGYAKQEGWVYIRAAGFSSPHGGWINSTYAQHASARPMTRYQKTSRGVLCGTKKVTVKPDRL